MKNALITGERGFIMSNLLPHLSKQYNISFYEVGIEYTDIDYIFHFASPSEDVEFTDNSKTAKSILQLSIALIHIAEVNNAHFIFASTQGTDNVTNNYEYYKSVVETYIKDVLSTYTILKIPRVYGRDRVKGLMRSIRDEKISLHDMGTVVEYCDIRDFVKQFRYNENVVYFNTISDTISDIKEKYVL